MKIDEDDFIYEGSRYLFGFCCSLKSCGKKSYRRKDVLLKSIKNKKSLFCSRECCSKARDTSVMVACSNIECDNIARKFASEVKRNIKSYCCKSCSVAQSNRENKRGANHHAWNGGHGSYRIRALRDLPNICSNKKCKLRSVFKKMPTKMLDIDHIDGDRSNNTLKNLQVLCVWCHAIKTRGVSPKDIK